MDKGTIKSWFTRGCKPTAAQFSAVFDSYRHSSDPVAISDVTNLATLLAAKVNSSDMAAAIAAAILCKQNATDPNLTTASQTIVGAINELNARNATRSYTLDFGIDGELIQDVNVQGLATIDRIITCNVAVLYVSYTGVVRQTIDLSQPISMQIPADEVLVWEIVRTTQNALACVGVRYLIN